MNKKEIYDDVIALLNDLKSDIEDTLADEVLDEVRDIELFHIEQDVFRSYSPKIYERRRVGGIDDPSNIIGEIRDMELEVDNIAEFNDDYFTYNHGQRLADLINDGEGKSGYYYDYPGEFERERPFIDNTIEEIQKTDSVENALTKGLKKRNYDII